MLEDQSKSPSNIDDELSLLDIAEFIKESWRTIIVFTLLGIAGAVLYLWQTPSQFEATAQIKMAQIAQFNHNSNALDANVEEPQALIARLALPTSYPKEAIVLCGLADQKHPEAALASKVRFSIPKGVGGTVNLRVRDASKDTTKACTDAVYQLIKTSQAQLIAAYIDEVEKKLKIEEERLSRFTQVIAKAGKSGAAVRPTYLVTRDEIRNTHDRISNLQNTITVNEGRTTRLAAPIYLKDQPVFPQKRKSLLAGLLLGSSLGLVLSLGCKWYRSSRAALKQ